jgi:hypothetical protein
MTPLFNLPMLLVIIALVVGLPLIQRPVVAAEVLTLGIAAVATNVLLGYTACCRSDRRCSSGSARTGPAS